MERKKTPDSEENVKPPKKGAGKGCSGDGAETRKNGGWQKIEAMREKAALKASLADVWDEDFDLDEEILAEMDHNAEFFTREEEDGEEVFDEDDGVDEFFEDDPV